MARQEVDPGLQVVSQVSTNKPVAMSRMIAFISVT